MKKIVTALFCAVVIAIACFAPPSAVAAPLRSNQQIVVFHADQDKTFAVGKDTFTFKQFASPNQNLPNLSAVEIRNVPQGNPGGFLLAKHVVNAPEDYYIVDGEFEFLSGSPSKTIKVNTGDLIHVPAGIPYGYRNIGSQSGRVLLVTPSQSFEAFIAEVGHPIANATIPADAPSPDMGKITSAAPKHGIEFLN